ncbi:MAG: ABC transporter substrate-binding protein [Proteobacteria bacterium]|nr:ABC transporter substrate-binding protein [Pseudomonadota bacterium]
MRKLIRGAALAVVLSFFAPTIHARELAVGLGASVTSADPHFHALNPNVALHDHIFEYLINQDAEQRLVPALATSWKAIDATTWEVKLRQGVKFHDGSTFDAEDVLATLKRVPWVPNSPSAFTIYTKSIAQTIVVDPYTIRFKTASPYPLLPNDLSNFFIINRKYVEASTEDFNRLKATIGTGPYKLVEFVLGERYVLERFDGYWGPEEPWEKVTFRQINSAPSRVAALLAGDVQLIENVPTADIESLKKNPDIVLSQGVSNRVIYFHMDHQRPTTPFITDKQGKPLDKNPLQDLRVRQALSKAINRNGIVARVMEGVAIPAGQLLPESFFGTSPNLKPMEFDPEGAKKLLAEAGYPNGFRLTLHASNDRYINDSRIVQTVAQMYSRIGIDAQVEVMPWATYATRATNREFSVFLVGWGSGTGETSGSLRALLACWDPARGMGTANRGRYCSKEMDGLLADALSTIDEKKRAQILAKASEIAMNDVGIIPLHYEVTTWATRKGLKYNARVGQETLAMEVRPTK